MLHRRTRVVMYGLGQIGTQIAQLVHQQPNLELVGAIDQDAKIVGTDLGVMLGASTSLGIQVQSNPTDVLSVVRPDVVVIATSSFLHEVFPQIRTCIEARAHVVSTCEELVYPVASHPEAAQSLDEMARAAGVAVLGIGSNPGFVMDLLPILMTATSVQIRRVEVQRVINASTRRPALQQRIGAGLDPIAFRAWIKQRSTPHIGLLHSMRMITDALGWQPERVEQTAEPIIADSWLRTPYVTVAPGQVAGIHQAAEGYVNHRPVVSLDWRTAIGLSDTHDAIKIDGDPPIDLLIRGGVHGDRAAAALVMRAVSALPSQRPGLRTVLDLPVLHYSNLTPQTMMHNIAPAR